MLSYLRVLALAPLLLSCAVSPPAGPEPPFGARAAEERAAARFDAVRGDPVRLAMFLAEMPKGGDLHNHLGGAVYAESYIRWAADAGLCADRATALLSPPPCDAAAGRPPVATALTPGGGGGLHDFLVDQWSMRNFVPGGTSGHDQFFATFGRFGPAGRGRTGDALAEVRARNAAQNALYLELMITADGGAAADLGTRLGWSDDLPRFRERLRAEGLADAVAAARRALDAIEEAAGSRLGCGTKTPAPGCDVEVRWLYQVLREQPPERVFAQIALGFDLVRADPRVVGLNLVQPEDGVISMRDYALHMSMLDTLHGLDPDVPVTLHAGELAPGLVPPDGLCCHIRRAIEQGHARRIGHGVSLAWERDAAGLLRVMAQRRILVEIALTSNAGILGVQGAEHPLRTYLAAGVPIALVTDDEGVSRSDLTREYFRAVREQGLGYRDLKASTRFSLEASFLPGASLWEKPGAWVPVAVCARSEPGRDKAPECQAFLDGSQRAALQWRLEWAWWRFERQLPTGP
jgi:hypothetical protein